MNKRVYVGGLGYSVDDDGLRGLFAPFGEVAFVKVIRDFHSGRSKGFGFVEMSTSEGAAEAVSGLRGAIHEQRTITVSEVDPSDSATSLRTAGAVAGRVSVGGARFVRDRVRDLGRAASAKEENK